MGKDSSWLCMTFLGENFCLDAYEKWLDVVPVSSIRSATTIGTLCHVFTIHTLPETCVSENGPAFISKECKEFLQINEIRQILSAPYHPASSGLAKRAVQTFFFLFLVTHTYRILLLRISVFTYRITLHAGNLNND